MRATRGASTSRSTTGSRREGSLMKSKPTRRSFFGQASVVLAVPLAATTAIAADDGDEVATRVAELEAMNAIRALLPPLLANPVRMALDARVRSVAADGGDV